MNSTRIKPAPFFRHCLTSATLRYGIAAAMSAVALHVCAQHYPARPIRLIVPFPPGGNSDAVARIVGQKLGERLAQQVVIDNRGGAGGNVGTEMAASAPPDGYTLLMGVQSALVVNPFLFARMPFDTVRDFAPISLINVFPLMLVVHPSVAVQNVGELINLAKAQPDKLTMATPANGAAGHLAGQLFKSMVGIRFVTVPYKGGGPAVNDLIAGQIRFMFLGQVAALPHVRSGRLKALATTGRARSKTAPELPTIAETGVAGFEVDSWLGMLAPARTSTPVIDKLSNELVALLKSPALGDRLTNQGADIIASTPKAFAEKIERDLVKWGRVVKATGAKLE